MICNFLLVMCNKTHCIAYQFPFSQEICYRVCLFKSKTGNKVEISFKETNSFPNYDGLLESLTHLLLVQSWASITHDCRKLETITNHSIIWFSIELKETLPRYLKHKLRFILPCKFECQPIFQNSFQIFK